MGMKNHAVVPIELIHKIARVNRGSTSFMPILKDQLVPSGLVAYEVDQRCNYRGYRLTNRGYDYLALNKLIKSEIISDLGSIIGSGKEADVYLAVAGDHGVEALGQTILTPTVEEDDDEDRLFFVIKFHRLGRTSFRTVKKNREYHKNGKACSWLYLDRLAAQREFDVMKRIYETGLPIPKPIAHNRNAVVMEYAKDAVPLCQVPAALLRADGGKLALHLYHLACQNLHDFVKLGLIHGDFNEFNLMVINVPDLDEETDQIDDKDVARAKLIVIDFPQVLSRDHATAQEIYDRDRQGVVSFFEKFITVSSDDSPSELEDVERNGFIDVELKAPGYIKNNVRKRMERMRLNEEDDDAEEEAGSSCEGDEEEDESAEETDQVDEGKAASMTEREMREHARERLRLENHRKERAQFNAHVKKQNRLGRKQKFSSNVKSEMEVFGL